MSFYFSVRAYCHNLNPYSFIMLLLTGNKMLLQLLLSSKILTFEVTSTSRNCRLCRDTVTSCSVKECQQLQLLLLTLCLSHQPGAKFIFSLKLYTQWGLALEEHILFLLCQLIRTKRNSFSLWQTEVRGYLEVWWSHFGLRWVTGILLTF